jgi:site-specific recombinase XerD
MLEASTPFGGKTGSRKGLKFPAEILSAREVESLLAGCSTRAPSGIRNRALLLLLYRSGLRIGEALALKPKDIDLDAATLVVLHGKGDRSRQLAFDSSVVDALARWLDTRKGLGFNGRGNTPLFCTLRGGPVSAPYIRQVLNRLAQKAGIEKSVRPHGLRHTFAAELCREGVPLNEIQQALGHSNAATTSRYLAHVAPEKMLATLRSRVWPPE